MSGGSSKGATPAGNTVTTQAPPSYMQPYIGTALGQAGNLLQSGGPQFYPGQQVAGFSQPQEQAFGNISGLANNYSPQFNSAMNFGTNLTGGNFSGPQANLATLGTPGSTNPFLDAMFNKAAGATQNQLASQFAGMGRNVEASEPARAEQLNNLATDIYGGAYQQDMNRALAANQALGGEQLGAFSQAPGMFNTQLGAQQQLGGVGGQIQGQAQQLIDANRNAYNYQQQLPYQQLQQYEQFLGGLTPGMSQTSPYFTNPTANALGTGLGGLALYNGIKGAMKAAPAATSDRRLKEDIKRVGSTEGGLPVYTFRYKGQEQVHMGVMADEVKQKQPEAVITGADGYDRVFYGMLK